MADDVTTMIPPEGKGFQTTQPRSSIWNRTLVSLDHHVTEYIRNRDVTTAKDDGMYTSGIPRGSKGGDGIFHSQITENTPDPLLVVAIVIFAVGAVLIAIGLARLVYFVSEPKGEKRHFRYILRYTDYSSSGKPEYDRHSDTQSDWI